MPRPSHLRGQLLGLLVVWCALAVLLALRPYRLEPSCLICPNAAAIDRQHGGLRFAAPGLARVAAPAALDRALATGDGLSIELWLTPADVRQGGPARIATLSRDPYRRNVTVGQERDALVFRLRTTATDPNGLAGQLAVPGFFAAGRRHHVAIAWDSRRTIVHLDGAERARVAGPPGSLSGWDDNLPLVLGNEPTGDRPWLGVIERIILRAGPVATGRLVADLDFTAGGHPAPGVVGADDLRIPRRFVRFDPWVVLEVGDFGLKDVVLHVGMLLPVGFLTTLLAAGGRRGPWRGVLVGALVVAAFAIGIEIAQYFFVGRSASVYDLASGLAGGAAGIAGAAGRRWRWRGRLAQDTAMRKEGG